MTTEHILAIVATVAITAGVKELIIHFFAPNKKVSKTQYDADMKEMKEKVASHKINNDEAFKVCKQSCYKYSEDLVRNSDEKRALEMKRIEDIIILQGKEQKAILNGLTGYIKGIDKRLENLENK